MFALVTNTFIRRVCETNFYFVHLSKQCLKSFMYQIANVPNSLYLELRPKIVLAFMHADFINWYPISNNFDNHQANCILLK